MLRKLGFARSLNYALCPKYWTWVKEKRKFSFFLTFDHLTTPIEGPDFFSILNLGFLRFLSREYPPHYLFTSTSFSNGFKVEKTHFWNWKTIHFILLFHQLDLSVASLKLASFAASAHDFASSAWSSSCAAACVRQDLSILSFSSQDEAAK